MNLVNSPIVTVGTNSSSEVVTLWVATSLYTSSLDAAATTIYPVSGVRFSAVRVMDGTVAFILSPLAIMSSAVGTGSSAERTIHATVSASDGLTVYVKE